jgi:hypothetical protein
MQISGQLHTSVLIPRKALFSMHRIKETAYDGKKNLCPCQELNASP